MNRFEQGSSEQASWVSPLANALSEALPRLHGGGPGPLVAELIEALTTALAAGELAIPLPSAAHLQALLASPLAREPDGPLVVEADQLLWRRWQQQRRSVLDQLVERAQTALSVQGKPEEKASKPALANNSQQPDPQQLRAVRAVLEHQLVLLEGGPGTGKTSTVVAMLAAVRAQQPECRIHLAAPTGKAAGRLKAAAAGFPCSTLHRLLESHGEGFRRNRRNPLALDLVVVDEVSMVDLDLMAALLEALPSPARLVLVGDGAQLAPVGAGSVLLELDSGAHRQALGAAAIRLTTTYRNNGAIAEVAASLRQESTPLATGLTDDTGLPDQTAALLASLDGTANLRWQRTSTRSLPAELLLRLRSHQRQLEKLASDQKTSNPEKLLALLANLLVLSPVRRGRWGVDEIHRALLGEALLAGAQRWPLGTPVLCQQNRDELGLANGDLGLVAEHGGRRQLLFASHGDGLPIWVHPAQLPGVQPAFALTVHKAQGSEASEVWVLLSDTGRPNQRLLYTALTRAKDHAVLITPS
ncbi:ATP-dependent RecD-like DNA helicase [Cyanobium sp. WAJ14-Wanaka]|uniref:ATP-dependent DNA helicase n=1 Tax=Cyanobium sp. WAJ14-Wanaka TaxID=2823725 RepID=UPI0020CCFE0F|nr:AAA family ATPase [Cyanobium sp. WAJ14-Wanaka]MCP9774266.1 AAA family ATPase [Cyanobium sp. WAJ14-Wanaka]